MNMAKAYVLSELYRDKMLREFMMEAIGLLTLTLIMTDNPEEAQKVYGEIDKLFKRIIKRLGYEPIKKG